MASGSITSWQMEKTETATDFIFLGPQSTADGNCSHYKRENSMIGKWRVHTQNELTISFTEPQKCMLLKQDPYNSHILTFISEFIIFSLYLHFVFLYLNTKLIFAPFLSSLGLISVNFAFPHQSSIHSTLVSFSSVYKSVQK